jgi:type I restriction enzyme R subunit
VIDVFTAAGLPKPDISILSDQFLAEVRGLKHKNVAAELLEKLLKDELKVRSKRNLVQSQVFSEKLKKTLNAYHNRAISTMQVLEELIKLARDLDAATKAGKAMGLTEDEKAFYDALAANDSAVTAMGDDKLKLIAAELITQVKKSVSIDWTLRESARAKIKVMVKRILNKYGSRRTCRKRPCGPCSSRRNSFARIGRLENVGNERAAQGPAAPRRGTTRGG